MERPTTSVDGKLRTIHQLTVYVSRRANEDGESTVRLRIISLNGWIETIN